MKVKLSLVVLTILLLSAFMASGQTSDNLVLKVLQSSYSERAYVAEPVTDQQLEQILQCGIKAPSARNLQPWKFTVVKDEATMKEAISDVVPGNVLIIVSATESQTGTANFDCGLATESMFVAAHGLGLGARIYGSPVANVNSKRELFQLPAGYNAVMILRVGNVDKTVDAVSAATPRNKFADVVNYRK